MALTVFWDGQVVEPNSTGEVAAGILACRGAGLPSPAAETSRKSKARWNARKPQSNPRLIRAAGMPPSTSGKDA